MYLNQRIMKNNETVMKRNNSKEYGDWIGKMGWRYMITIRKNYKTNSTVVRNTANKLIKGIVSCDRAVYVGERDSVDYNNYHIHILINGKDKELLLNGLNNYKKKHKGDLVHIEEIKNNRDAGMYITKHFNINTLTKSDIVWDIILN
jgi:hypothetical protein